MSEREEGSEENTGNEDGNNRELEKRKEDGRVSWGEKKESVFGRDLERDWAGNVYAKRVDSIQEKGLRKTKSDRQNSLFFDNLTWLTSSEAADYLRLPSVGALRVMVFKRSIPFHKLGRSLRFRRSDLDRMLDCSRNGGI